MSLGAMALPSFHRVLLRHRVLKHGQCCPCSNRTLQGCSRCNHWNATLSFKYEEGLLRPVSFQGRLKYAYSLIAKRGFAKKRIRLNEYEEYDQKLDPRRVPLAFVRVPIHHQSAAELVETITTAGQLRLSNPNFWKRCTTAAGDLSCGFRVKELVNIVNAYAKANVRDEQLFNVLAPAIAAQITECRASDIAVAAQAFARVYIRHDALLNVIATEAANRIHEMGPRGVAVVMWSFARLEVRHESLVSKACRAVAENIGEYSSIDLTQTLWSLGELNVTDVAVLTRICDHIMSHLAGYSISELLLCTCALSKVLSFDHDIVPAMRSLFVQQLREIPLPQLPRLLQAFTALDRIPTYGREPSAAPGLYRLIVRSVLRNISFFRPEEIEQIRQSLAAINLTDGLLDGVAYDVLPAKIRALPAEDLVSLLDFHSFAGSQELPLLDDILLELYGPSETRQGKRDLDVTEEQSLRCLEALVRMHHVRGFLYVLQSLLDRESKAGDPSHPDLSLGKDGRGLILRNSPSLLVVQRLLLQMAPTADDFDSIRSRLLRSHHSAFARSPVLPSQPVSLEEAAILYPSVEDASRVHDCGTSFGNDIFEIPQERKDGERNVGSNSVSGQSPASLSRDPPSISHSDKLRKQKHPARGDASRSISESPSLSGDRGTERCGEDMETFPTYEDADKLRVAEEETENEVITVSTASTSPTSPRQSSLGEEGLSELIGCNSSPSKSEETQERRRPAESLMEVKQSILRQRSPGQAIFNYLAPGSQMPTSPVSEENKASSTIFGSPKHDAQSSRLSFDISGVFKGALQGDHTQSSSTDLGTGGDLPHGDCSQNWWKAVFASKHRKASASRLTQNSSAECVSSLSTSPPHLAASPLSQDQLKTEETRSYDLSSKLPLNFNLVTKEFYETIAFASQRSTPSVLIAAIARFPQDSARALWWKELMNGKVEELEAELLPAVLLELGRVLDANLHLTPENDEKPLEKKNGPLVSSSCPSTEDAKGYYADVIRLLFTEGKQIEKSRGTSCFVGGSAKSFPPPKYKCLSNSALAVCVKTLEIHPDRSKAARHAAACVQLYLRRLAGSNSEDMTDNQYSQDDRDHRTCLKKSEPTLAAREATAKQLARMLHSLVAFDVTPPQRLCAEIARRVNYLSISDMFTVLRLFRVLGGIDELTASHLSIGLSTRRWQVRSWRKLRELEFLCKQLGVDLDDDYLSQDSKTKLGGGTIAEALDDGEDDEALGAVELPKDSDLPRLKAELGKT
ncbi:hypothetical protein CSUI_000080 [Cystoisospora suis]|uniref:RNA-editing substrate-binding complex 6 protein domain-containing protein n=1 Tax=Cystoisospora suis TaxID=483139 RepID=A0A2C6LFB4_9APIC|nr:hypothetical protein CSUI_000080 [Cystoisospora suis]